MELEDGKELHKEKQKRSSVLSCCIKCLPVSSNSNSLPEQLSGDDDDMKEMTAKTQRKPGGWRTMPYVLGNETFERLASNGLTANFTVFLLTVYHMDQVSVSNLLNIWAICSNITPLIGAFISDSYIGRFWAIAFSSFAEFLGMLTLTIIASLPQLRPPPCTTEGLVQQCKDPTHSQLAFLIMGLGFMSIGAGGIRPCSIPFGVDQFDASTKEGRKGINSFFNWYYTSSMVVVIIAMTMVVYIQDSVSWALGFGIPTGFMMCGIFLFFLGMRVYIYVKPNGSIFTGIAQVIVAAYKKRNVKLPNDDDDGSTHVYYDLPLPTGSIVTKLPLTNEYRFLNKAAIVMEGELNADGKCRNPWKLCSIQQMEEVKCIIRIIPIWPSGFVSALAIIQQSTFTISQALNMDRHIGRKFQIPAGSISVVSFITVAIWLPLYDCILMPRIQKRTRIDGGITMLQRMGIGLAISILAMVISGIVETKRRAAAAAGNAPISVAWLFPQLIAMGFAEAFNIVGLIVFYNKEFPESMISMGNALSTITWAVAGYMSSLLVNTIHKTTSFNGRPDWLTKDINAGRVDNFYFVIAGMGVANLVYFVLVARRYRYKSKIQVDDSNDDDDDGVEV